MNMAAAGGAGVDITVHQTSKLIDTRLDVTITGLLPRTKVTIALGIYEHKAAFVSYAHFTSDDHGCVQLSRDAPHGGTYAGVDSMALFWSMRHTKEHTVGMRLVQKNVMQPLKFKLAVFDGHIKVDSIHQFSTPAVLCEQVIERWYHDASQVDRIQIRHGRLRGALFVPKYKGRVPGVLDFFGGTGTLMDFRGALLATKGFVVFSLAYGSYDDLPVLDLDLTYFDEAIDFLISHPAVVPGGIGVMGNSKGSEVALHLYTYNPHVRATVAINGWAFYAPPTRTPNKDLFETYEYDIFGSSICKKDYTILLPAMPSKANELKEKAFIPIEKSPKGRNLLLIQAEDDPNVGCHTYAFLTERMKRAGRSDYRLISYPNTGHILEPPYTPLNPIVYILGINFFYGGKIVDHAKSQQDFWYQVPKFLEDNLPKRSIDGSHSNLDSKL